MTHKVHFIAMSGSYGCIPDNVTVFEKRIDAVRHLIDLFELPVNGSRANDLRITRYTDLGQGFGADYAEVQKCNCDHPEIHDETFEESL
jgi:hypothetical protein